MNRWRLEIWALAAFMAVVALQLMAQQDQGPVLRPQRQIPKSENATLLVQCDMACNWELDGQAMGLIAAGGMAKTKVELGQHLIGGLSPDSKGRVEKDLDIKTVGQTVVHLELFQAFLMGLRGTSESLTRGLALNEGKNYGEAKALFQKACDGGDMDGCIQLGLIDEDAQKGDTGPRSSAHGLSESLRRRVLIRMHIPRLSIPQR